MEEVFGNATIALSVDDLTENGIENFASVKAKALEDVAVFKGIVISEDNLEEAPKWRAELNKKAKRISDFRIAFEKDYKKRIEKSTSQLKELASIYTEASMNIDEQVKSFDDKRKQEKIEQIQQVFEDVFSEWKSIFDVSKIESFSDGKWMNKGTSLDSIRKFMTDTKSKIENGIASIRGLKSKYEQEMIHAFLQRLDMSDALNRKTQLEDFEEQMNAKKRAEESAKEETQQSVQENIQDTVHVEENVKEEAKEEPIYRLQFAVYGTKEQLRVVANFIKDSGLRYERI
jgi:hypothetical protein